MRGSSNRRWEPESRPDFGDRFGDRTCPLPHLGTHEGCANDGTRETLVPYAFGTCSEDEALQFEAHLLDCDACYEDLKTLDRARELVQGWTMPQRIGTRRVPVEDL